jgi:chromosome segregation ATPase
VFLFSIDTAAAEKIERKGQARNFLSHKGWETTAVPIETTSHPEQRNISTKLQEENSNLLYKISFNELELKKLKAELDSLYTVREKARVSEEELTKLKKECLSREEELLNLNFTLKNLETDKANLAKRLEDLQKESKKELMILKNEMETKIQQLEKDKRKLDDVLIQKESDITNLRLKMGDAPKLSPLPNELQIKIDECEKDNRRIKSELELKCSLIDRMEVKIQNEAAEKERLSEQLSVVRKENDRLQSEKLLLAEEISQLQKKVVQTINLESSDLKEKDKEIETLKLNLETENTKCFKLQQQNETIRDELRGKLKELEVINLNFKSLVISKDELSKTLAAVQANQIPVPRRLPELREIGVQMDRFNFHESSSVKDDNSRADLEFKESEISRLSLKLLTEETAFNEKIKSYEERLSALQHIIQLKESQDAATTLSSASEKDSFWQEKLEETMINSKNQVLQLKMEIQRRCDSNNALQQRLEQKEKEFEDFVVDKERLISSLRLEIRNFAEAVRCKDDELQKFRNSVESLNLSLKRVEFSNVALNESVSNKDFEITQLQNEILKVHSDSTASSIIQTKFQDTFRELCDLKIQLQSKEIELSISRSELDMRGKTIEATERKAQQIQLDHHNALEKVHSLQQENYNLMQTRDSSHRRSEEIAPHISSDIAHYQLLYEKVKSENNVREAENRKLRDEYEKTKSENNEKETENRILREEYQSLKSKYDLLFSENNLLQSNINILNSTVLKMTEENAMKEKSIKGFTEELLFVQKKLSEYDQKYMFTDHAYRPQEVNRNPPEDGKENAHNAKIEQNLAQIKSELQERRNESNQLFKFLQGFEERFSSQKAASRKLEDADFQDNKDDWILYDDRHFHESLADAQSDDLDSIFESNTNVFSWSSNSIFEFFEEFNKSLLPLTRNAAHNECILKKQLKRRKLSSSLDSKGFAEKTIISSALSYLQRELQTFNSFQRSLNSLKTFIKFGRKELEKMKVSDQSLEKTVKLLINSLTIDMNLLIRFTRNFQESCRRRGKVLIALKHEIVPEQLGNNFSSYIVELSTNLKSMEQEISFLREMLVQEHIKRNDFLSNLDDRLQNIPRSSVLKVIPNVVGMDETSRPSTKHIIMPDLKDYQRVQKDSLEEFDRHQRFSFRKFFFYSN